MKRFTASVLVSLALAACSGATEPSVPTTITLSTSTITLDAVGARQIVTASVKDQHGGDIGGAGVTWSSSSPSVTVTSTGSDSATVTAVANGTATLTATSGAATATVTVQVVQAFTAIDKLSGDAQTGTAGTNLPAPIRVRALDRLSSPVPGITITLAVSAGGGSLSATTLVTGADGTATATWKVGTVAGAANTVTATASGVAAVTFTATVVAGPPVTISIVAGDRQSAGVGTAVPVAPAVRVIDSFGNPVKNTSVVFTVTTGGGTLTGSAATTDNNGVAAVSSWILGEPGTNTMTASVPGSGATPAVFTATGIPSSGASSIQPSAGEDQAARANTAVPTPPAVVVRDAAGNPLVGLPVVFTATTGGGSVTGASTTTDAGGVARVGSWVLGPVLTLNTLTATVSGGIFIDNTAVFEAAPCVDGSATDYAITVCAASALTTSQQAAFTGAAARWGAIVTSDLPSVAFTGTDACGVSLSLTVDDLLIFAALDDIDGPGNILGQAGPCARRSGGGLPVIGVMQFDVADMASIETRGQLNDVILHEMGHVLGIGTYWSLRGLLQDPSGDPGTGVGKLDTYYTGTGGLAGFEAIGGASYTLGRKVPVENEFGAGTRNAHWRESVLKTELMTGFIGNGRNPLSVLTARSLEDLGYTVDASKADVFTIAASVRSGPDTGSLQLLNDLYTGPLYSVDPRGRMQRIR
jgi:hypothetical protein